MKKAIIILLLLSQVPMEAFSAEVVKMETLDKGKNGRYKKKSHWFKKLIMGKRYCDCPKH
jgi:hypothetical protein